MSHMANRNRALLSFPADKKSEPLHLKHARRKVIFKNWSILSNKKQKNEVIKSHFNGQTNIKYAWSRSAIIPYMAISALRNSPWVDMKWCMVGVVLVLSARLVINPEVMNWIWRCQSILRSLGRYDIAHKYHLFSKKEARRREEISA